MIRDLSDAPRTELGSYDLCIVGTGPAGMTLANELAPSGLSLCVLESGKLRATPFGDALRRVESEGIRVKDYSRERVFGGASTTWAGLSSPLDEIDLEPRPWIRESGWPIKRSELLTYYRAAAKYRFPELEAFGPGGFGALRAGGPRSLEWSSLDEKVFLAAGEPQNFAREWRQVFDRANVDLYLDATVVRLEQRGDAVTRAHVRSSGGGAARVEARVFVVATGGIENARLLLQSPGPGGVGIGNARRQVGKWLMNHPKNYFGTLVLDDAVDDWPYYFGCLHGGFAGYAGLRLSSDAQRTRRVLNSYVRFEPLFPWSGSRGVESLVTIVKHSKVLLTAFKARRRGKTVSLRDYSETGDDSDLQNERRGALGWTALGFHVLFDAPRVARYAYHRLFERVKPRVRAVRLRNFMEMEPRPENEVVLGNQRDAFGEPVPVVRHACSELDKRSLVELHRELAHEFAAASLGRLESPLTEEAAAPGAAWPIDQDASHHMGTTRMGTDPAVSVVDQHLRVHDCSNLYMAGASVFPTSGCANPTFTIVALSIRLAAHLRERVFAAAPRRTPES